MSNTIIEQINSLCLFKALSEDDQKKFSEKLKSKTEEELDLINKLALNFFFKRSNDKEKIKEITQEIKSKREYNEAMKLFGDNVFSCFVNIDNFAKEKIIYFFYEAIVNIKLPLIDRLYEDNFFKAYDIENKDDHLIIKNEINFLKSINASNYSNIYYQCDLKLSNNDLDNLYNVLKEDLLSNNDLDNLYNAFKEDLIKLQKKNYIANFTLLNKINNKEFEKKFMNMDLEELRLITLISRKLFFNNNCDKKFVYHFYEAFSSLENNINLSKIFEEIKRKNMEKFFDISEDCDIKDKVKYLVDLIKTSVDNKKELEKPTENEFEIVDFNRENIQQSL